jgi:hypothetical protein
MIILAAVSVVLLIACANVANLQLARGAARARASCRSAPRSAPAAVRLAQQLLTESVLLSLAGGVLGVVLAVGLRKTLATLITPQLPVNEPDIRLDMPVLLFALGVSMVTGLLFGLAPGVEGVAHRHHRNASQPHRRRSAARDHPEHDSSSCSSRCRSSFSRRPVFSRDRFRRFSASTRASTATIC